MFGKIIEVSMKCQFDNCENEANKCTKRKIILGKVTKKPYYFCNDHKEEEIKKYLECQSMSAELENPMCDVKKLIKKV